MSRRAVASVDLSAIAANCDFLRGQLIGGASLCAVVKADGYGHGMVEAARAAVKGGCSTLAVVTAEEATALRESMPDVGILVMGPLEPAEVQELAPLGVDLAAWRPDQVLEIAEAARAHGVEVAVHIKLDTGMGRFGARREQQALECIELATQTAAVRPAGIWTHFATADEDEGSYFDLQLARFTSFVRQAKSRVPDLIAHCANSAATLRREAAQMDMIRCGIAIYGLDPFHGDAQSRGLVPALSLTSYVAAVSELGPGESVGYGRRYVAEGPTRIATIPIGYGDGWRRILSGRADVLIGGIRMRQVGTVSMDSITVDAGDHEVALGDQVVLIGRQGQEQITTEEVAAQAETINYEITCGLTPRTRRMYTGADA